MIKSKIVKASHVGQFDTTAGSGDILENKSNNKNRMDDGLFGISFNQKPFFFIIYRRYKTGMGYYSISIKFLNFKLS